MAKGKAGGGAAAAASAPRSLPPTVLRSRALLRKALSGEGGALLRAPPAAWTRLSPGVALAAVSGCDLFVRRGGAGGESSGGAASGGSSGARPRFLLSLPGRLAPLQAALAAGTRLGELAGLDGPNPTLTLEWPPGGGAVGTSGGPAGRLQFCGTVAPLR